MIEKDKTIEFDLKYQCKKFMSYLEYHGIGSNAQAGIPLILADVKEFTIGDIIFSNPELK